MTVIIATICYIPDIIKKYISVIQNKSIIVLFFFIRKYLKRGDYAHLHYETHRLLGASRFFRITNVTKTIEEIEKCFRKNENCDDIDALANQLKMQLQMNKHQLDEIMDDLSR
jgi:hypothetical protein